MHDSPGFVHLRRSALPAPRSTHHCTTQIRGKSTNRLRERNKTALYIDHFGVIFVPILHFVLLRRIASGNQSFIFSTKSIFDWDCTVTFLTRIGYSQLTPSLPHTGFALLNPRRAGGFCALDSAHRPCDVSARSRWILHPWKSQLAAAQQNAVVAGRLTPNVQHGQWSTKKGRG